MIGVFVIFVVELIARSNILTAFEIGPPGPKTEPPPTDLLTNPMMAHAPRDGRPCYLAELVSPPPTSFAATKFTRSLRSVSLNAVL
jgi:hypothetical protein